MSKSKVATLEKAMEEIKDGMTIMVGGFLGTGTPDFIIDAIVAKGVKDLTLICNDTAFVDKGSGKFVVNRMLKKAIVSHIGTNKETGNQMLAGELEVVLTPQGTLAEQIRAGGMGIGGIYTETGVGTDVAKGKETKIINGKEYLLELPLHADVAIIGASIADECGNLYYKGATRNFNPLMAAAADVVIVGAEEIVKVGEIAPSDVMTPGILVDYVVGGNK